LNEKTLFDEIVEGFKVLDKDNDGFLNRCEIKGVLLKNRWDD
jgi:Ca2+-binding EF-hand superfamily protein